MRLLKKVLVAIFAVYLSLAAALTVFQTNLLFPAPPFENLPLPAAAEVVLIKTTDGETLRSIYLARDRKAQTIVFFHGNGGSAERELQRGGRLRDAGYNVLLAEYRGYGGSSGKPTAAGLKMDVLATYDWVATNTAKKPIIYAHSLGTGLAVHLAANRPAATLILEAAYSSIADVASRQYPYFPVSLLLHNDIRPIDEIVSVNRPILMMHGKLDGLIPIELGERLRTAAESNATNNVTWVSLPQAGHNDLANYGSIERVIGFIKAQVK